MAFKIGAVVFTAEEILCVAPTDFDIYRECAAFFRLECQVQAAVRTLSLVNMVSLMSLFMLVFVNYVQRVIFYVGWLVGIFAQIDLLAYYQFVIWIDVVNDFAFVVIGLIILVFAWKLDRAAYEDLQISDSYFLFLDLNFVVTMLFLKTHIWVLFRPLIS